MAETGLSVFDKTFHHTNSWILDLNERLNLNNKHKAFTSLRAVLHAIRDRLIYTEAVHLGSQLPVLLAGYYYQGWKPSEVPVKTRNIDGFISHVEQEIGDVNIKYSSEEIVEHVFLLLHDKITAGELDDIFSMLPEKLEELWSAEAMA